MTTLVRAQYFPAAIRLPDAGQAVTKRHVILAEGGDHDGLWVYQRPDVVEFHGLIDWEKTVVPTTRQARSGVDVHLADGSLVVVTAGGGCRCGAIGRWAGPVWATNVASHA